LHPEQSEVGSNWITVNTKPKWNLNKKYQELKGGSEKFKNNR
jgi:hypothetical protein